MESMVTRCPKCATAFRVSHAHLQTAKGAVRCGACLHVFQAADHQVQVATPTANAPTPQPQVAATAPIAVAAPPPTANPTIPPAELAVAIPESAPNSAFEDDEDSDELFNDDPEADRLLDAEEESDEIAEESERYTDTFLQLDGWQPDENTFSEDDFYNTDESEDKADETWAKELLAELEDEDGNNKKRIEPTFSEDAIAEALFQESPQFAESDATDKSQIDNIDNLEEIEDLEELGQSDLSPIADSLFNGRDEIISQIEPEPLVLNWEKTPNRWLPQVGWLVLGCCALIGLLTQYAWYERDTLARDPQYRPWFTLWCQQWQCKLPDLQDLQAIRSQNLVVRSHPHIDQALVIDTIIINNAVFEQPFPSLRLSFSDINNNAVANRIFAPSEYLGGELAGAKLMPAQQPIHLSLEILEPSQEAVNYELAFVTP